MDLSQLQTFRTVARHEHVTRAAAALNVAQPAVSKTVARLEAELGVPLFDRQGRGVRLNAFGQAFLRRVDRVFAELDEARRELADLAGPDAGEVTIAAETLRPFPELLREFSARHPRVRFRLSQAPTAEMRTRLERGAADLCMASLPLEGTGLASAALLTEEVLLVVPPGHPLARRRRVDLREAAGEPFVSARPGYWQRALGDAFCARAGFTPTIVCESEEPGATRSLISAGLGVGFLPASGRRAADAPPGAWLRVREPRCERTLRLAWREDRYLSAAAQAFRAHAVEYFAGRG